MLDLHRHDEFSLFDGFGKAEELAELAKEKGYTALGLANHGNTTGLVKHYFGCKKYDIKPVLGIEAYFQPAWNKEKPRYHLCLFAKDLEGYANLNNLVTISENQKYYQPVLTFKDLAKHSKGIICTSACVAGFIPKMIKEGNNKTAIKAAKKFQQIYGDDFYLEVQPYKLSQVGMQEKVNIKVIEIGEKLGIKCILTSDSHYGDKNDFDTYLKMHELKGTQYDVGETYGERYMPELKEMGTRFIKMHEDDFSNVKKLAKQMYNNLEELEAKVEDNILEQLELELPQFIEGRDSFDLLLRDVKKGLKDRGKNNKKYIKRCKEELEVIKAHGFSDYFLMVADYVKWAKLKGIAVGPGRGSVCNSQVAWALGITEVDSLKFGLDFRRFLRHDKTAIPDIDLDFQTSRRAEVMDYIIDKYKGHAAQICNYGLYKVDNLLNDLVKVCGMEDKNDIAELKKFVNKYVVDGRFDYKSIMNTSEVKYYNSQYDNIIKHFSKMYLKVRYIGTHAAGVAITGGKLSQYVALKPDKKSGKIFTVYDLSDLEKVNVIKFDILGLNTMEQISELRELTGDTITEDWFEDEKIFEQFGLGNTDGIFQLEKEAAKDILRNIQADCFEDVVAASSMNRPGPLSLGMPQHYAENKFNVDEAKKSKYYEYTKETYGTIVYQEQLQQICVNIGQMSWADSDRVMKILKGTSVTTENLKKVEANKDELISLFIAGAIQNGFTKKEATELFEKLLVYTFNKGHGVGYTIISLEEMYYKIYYPTEYWYVKCKYAPKETDRWKYTANAVVDGAVVFLPHVNYTADYTLRKEKGDVVIQEGLQSIKNVGPKAAKFIEDERKKNGNFKDYNDFIERCVGKGKPVNKGVVSALDEQGALEFRRKTYIDRVIKYNSTLYMKGMR